MPDLYDLVARDSGIPGAVSLMLGGENAAYTTFISDRTLADAHELADILSAQSLVLKRGADGLIEIVPGFAEGIEAGNSILEITEEGRFLHFWIFTPYGRAQVIVEITDAAGPALYDLENHQEDDKEVAHNTPPGYRQKIYLRRENVATPKSRFAVGFVVWSSGKA